MNLKKYFCGNEMGKMSDISFRIMSFIFKLRDIFLTIDKRLDNFGIKESFTVIDYGCGPGSYLNKASQLVGEKGKVYAVDIHELALESVKKKIVKYNLKNVMPVLVDGYSCDIDDHIADIIYVLDTFHMIKEPEPFLKELHRLLKEEGFLLIDDGHQPRGETKMKINNAKVWNIVEESKDHLKCLPV